MRGGQREIPPVGADINEHHPGTENLLHQGSFLGLVPARQTDFAHDPIVKMA